VVNAAVLPCGLSALDRGSATRRIREIT